MLFSFFFPCSVQVHKHRVAIVSSKTMVSDCCVVSPSLFPPPPPHTPGSHRHTRPKTPTYTIRNRTSIKHTQRTTESLEPFCRHDDVGRWDHGITLQYTRLRTKRVLPVFHGWASLVPIVVEKAVITALTCCAFGTCQSTAPRRNNPNMQ